MRKILLFLYTEDGGDQGDRGDHLLPPPQNSPQRRPRRSPWSPWSPPCIFSKLSSPFGLLGLLGEFTIVISIEMRKILLYLYTKDGVDQGDRGDHHLPPPP